jgi:hypothetical protein
MPEQMALRSIEPILQMCKLVFPILIASFPVLAKAEIAADPPHSKPNIIFVVADDMGRHDTGYSGNPVAKTPHLDAMAAEGLRFDSFYAAHATCSPGRMAILTGRTPLRARIGGVSPEWR